MDESRLMRGFELFQKGCVQPIADRFYRVNGYVVDTVERTCTCPDWRYRGGLCKHLYAALFYEKNSEVQVGLELAKLRKAPVAETVYQENVV